MSAAGSLVAAEEYPSSRELGRETTLHRSYSPIWDYTTGRGLSLTSRILAWWTSRPCCLSLLIQLYGVHSDGHSAVLLIASLSLTLRITWRMWAHEMSIWALGFDEQPLRK